MVTHQVLVLASQVRVLAGLLTGKCLSGAVCYWTMALATWSRFSRASACQWRFARRFVLNDSAAIILAAGKSTRMKSGLPKVLHEICGKPMLAYVLDACREAGIGRLIVVVGHGKEEVLTRFSFQEDITWVEQTEQLGTGHAVLCCREALSGFEGSIVVIAGDMPLLRCETLSRLLDSQARGDCAVTLATTVLDDPAGYGRIVRDADGGLQAIVEDRDCTPEQRKLCEVNPSYYCFDAKRMVEALDRVKPDNTKGEYYITDAVRISRDSGWGACAIEAVPAEDATGINSRADLALVNRLMQRRIQQSLMQEGVTIIDPESTWIEAGASVGLDTIVHPFTFVGSEASIGEGCRLGPFAHVGRGETLVDRSVAGPSMCGEAV